MTSDQSNLNLTVNNRKVAVTYEHDRGYHTFRAKDLGVEVSNINRTAAWNDFRERLARAVK